MARGDKWQAYRDAIAARVHAVCLDRNLDLNSVVNTEAGCRIESCLPLLVEAARSVGSHDPDGFEATVEQVVCRQCGNQDALGHCRMRGEAACCLYRYLPLVYQAICSVGNPAA